MSGIDSTHDPALRSWVASAAGHGEFSIQNLPLGIFSRTGEKPRPGVAIGDRVLDLPAVTGLLGHPAIDRFTMSLMAWMIIIAVRASAPGRYDLGKARINYLANGKPGGRTRTSTRRSTKYAGSIPAARVVERDAAPGLLVPWVKPAAGQSF